MSPRGALQCGTSASENRFTGRGLPRTLYLPVTSHAAAGNEKTRPRLHFLSKKAGGPGSGYLAKAMEKIRMGVEAGVGVIIRMKEANDFGKDSDKSTSRHMSDLPKIRIGSFLKIRPLRPPRSPGSS